VLAKSRALGKNAYIRQPKIPINPKPPAQTRKFRQTAAIIRCSQENHPNSGRAALSRVRADDVTLSHCKSPCRQIPVATDLFCASAAAGLTQIVRTKGNELKTS